MIIKFSHFSKFSNNLGIRSESSQCTNTSVAKFSPLSTMEIIGSWHDPDIPGQDILVKPGLWLEICFGNPRLKLRLQDLKSKYIKIENIFQRLCPFFGSGLIRTWIEFERFLILAGPSWFKSFFKSGPNSKLVRFLKVFGPVRHDFGILRNFSPLHVPQQFRVEKNPFEAQNHGLKMWTTNKIPDRSPKQPS